MKRQVDMSEISDGRLYTRTDMVRAGCGGCHGCSSCCSGMGNSVVLDPMDIYRLTAELGTGFEALLQTNKIELNVVDGIILPNLKMKDDKETCGFLDENGRCSIHPYRPGICRLFPLGRFYEEETRSFRYFLQVKECPVPNKTKVKVEKWVDTPQFPRYEQFIKEWHYLLSDVQETLSERTEEEVKNVSLYILKLFYMMPYQKTDFYTQFAVRLGQAKEVLF